MESAHNTHEDSNAFLQKSMMAIATVMVCMAICIIAGTGADADSDFNDPMIGITPEDMQNVGDMSSSSFGGYGENDLRMQFIEYNGVMKLGYLTIGSTLSGIMPQPVEGQIFLGWSTVEGDPDYIINPDVPVYEEFTLWSVWVKADAGYDETRTECKVLLVDGEEELKIWTYPGSVLDLNSYTFDDDGRIFRGWFSDSEFTEPVDGMVQIEHDAVFYAKYSIDSVIEGQCGVSYDDNCMCFNGGSYYVHIGGLDGFNVMMIGQPVTVNPLRLIPSELSVNETYTEAASKDLEQYLSGMNPKYVEEIFNYRFQSDTFDTNQIGYRNTVGTFKEFIDANSDKLTENIGKRLVIERGTFASFVSVDVDFIEKITTRGDIHREVFVIFSNPIYGIQPVKDGSTTNIPDGHMECFSDWQIEHDFSDKVIDRFHDVIVKYDGVTEMKYCFEQGSRICKSDLHISLSNTAYSGMNWVPISSDLFNRDYMFDEVAINTSDIEIHVITVPKEYEGSTIITRGSELTKINDDLAGSYVLAKDINPGNMSSIGCIDTTYTPFTGKFYGAGHTINGLNIEKQNPVVYRSNMGSDGNYYVFTGLFCELGPGACVKDLNITNSRVYSTVTGDGEWHAMGALAGRANNATIDNIVLKNVKVDNDDTSDANCVGGLLIGIAEHNTNISDCTTDSNCYIWGEGMDCYIGGIVGAVEHGGATIANCVNHGILSSTEHRFWGDAAAGGIVGATKFNGWCDVDRCLNAGEVKTYSNFWGGYRDSGGIVGRNYSDYCVRIMQCHIVQSLLIEGNHRQGDRYMDGGDFYDTNNSVIKLCDKTSKKIADIITAMSSLYTKGSEYLVEMKTWIPS